jgi:hypothetical protein
VHERMRVPRARRKRSQSPPEFLSRPAFATVAR